MSHIMMDSLYVGIIIRKIEKKLRWRKVSFWTDNEYRKLSLLIYKDTSISISPQTLKRLFGKVKYKDVYTPQPATKNALARFLKYADWESFVLEQTGNKFRFRTFLNKRNTARNRKLAGFLLITAVVAFSLFLMVPGKKNRKVTFYAENLSGVTPHTVSFHYDISNLGNKNVFIDFDHKEAEDNSPGELLDKSRTLLNHCYESPGFFNVTISSDGKELASVKIHSLSDGWASYCFNDDNFILRKFVFGLEKKARDTLDDGLLYISPRDLNNQGFNGNTVFYLEHMIYKDFMISADSCTLEVNYKNSPDMGGISCYDVEFRIIGENGLASVMLVQKGCYRWSEIIVGEKQLNGKYHNLSSFSTDLSLWNVFRMNLKSNKATITNGSDTLFTCDYVRQLGRIKGIRLLTKGSGAFDYVKLFNARRQEIYDENFGK